MIRIAIYLLGILLLVFGLNWLAMQPGAIIIEWPGHRLPLSLRAGLLLLAGLLTLILLAWAVLRWVWRSPAMLGRFLDQRRRQRGLDALTSGIIAAGAGDRALAQRYAAQARKSLPHEPLTHLLRAEAAQIGG
ncbi:MAG TPA: heme biosynthesis HemY N-terminal domain-containing protein, partial [Hyphomicrobiaceae bacterium]|nr:heme biosynthesis HemY N-terminal domain-containing protein [Hyphomicrobiaceae bacterium]